MPSCVLEPSCGTGNFIKASLSFGAGKYYGIELSGEHCSVCRSEIRDDRVEIINGDFFACNLEGIERDNLLVIGIRRGLSAALCLHWARKAPWSGPTSRA